jgi:hypothetical protein
MCGAVATLTSQQLCQKQLSEAQTQLTFTCRQLQLDVTQLQVSEVTTFCPRIGLREQNSKMRNMSSVGFVSDPMSGCKALDVSLAEDTRALYHSFVNFALKLVQRERRKQRRKPNAWQACHQAEVISIPS